MQPHRPSSSSLQRVISRQLSAWTQWRAQSCLSKRDWPQQPSVSLTTGGAEPLEAHVESKSSIAAFVQLSKQVMFCSRQRNNENMIQKSNYLESAPLTTQNKCFEFRTYFSSCEKMII